jgi:predicted Zn finger-like uncharacterized protein
MILKCDNCQSRFKLDESLLKKDGSKVRCSLCRNVFMAFPPDETFFHGKEELPPEPEGPEETVILDSPPGPDDMLGVSETGEQTPSGSPRKDESEDAVDFGVDFDFDEDSPPETEERAARETMDAFPPKDLSDPDEARTDMDDAFDRAARIKEDITREDMEDKEPEAEAESNLFPAPEVSRRRRSVLVPVLLGLLLILVAGYAALYYLAPGRIPEAITFMKPHSERTQEEPGVRRLSFEGVKGSFVFTEDGTQRFIIMGSVVNNYPAPRSFIRLKASILDEHGGIVTSRVVFAGNPFTQGELVGRPMDFLEERSNRPGGEEGRNIAVPTGGRVPFMVVFQDLPENISEFTVEGVSSVPADRD